MQGRSVEVAVGFSDHTWRAIWVTVPEDPDYVLDDDEASEKAHEIALAVANQAGWSITFTYVLYVQSPDGDLDDLV